MDTKTRFFAKTAGQARDRVGQERDIDLLSQESVSGEAGTDVQSHDTNVYNECDRDADPGQLAVGPVEQNAAAERAHSELCREKGQIARIEKCRH